MKLDIRAGKRILYKHNNQWEVGVLARGTNAAVLEKGLFLMIIPKEFIGMPDNEIPYVHDAEINDIFLDAVQLEDWVKDYKDNFMTKEEYIQFIETEDFSKAIEQAYVSDGEYYYYPISKFNRAWIEKQPFNYVVRLT